MDYPVLYLIFSFFAKESNNIFFFSKYVWSTPDQQRDAEPDPQGGRHGKVSAVWRPASLCHYDKDNAAENAKLKMIAEPSRIL